MNGVNVVSERRRGACLAFLCSPRSCTSACRAGSSRCRPRSCVSACRAGTGCSPRSCTGTSACRAGSRCSPRSRVSACHAGRGCSPRSCVSACRAGSRCSPRSFLSASRAGKACTVRSGASPSRAYTVYVLPSLAADRPSTSSSRARRLPALHAPPRALVFSTSSRSFGASFRSVRELLRRDSSSKPSEKPRKTPSPPSN